MLYTVEGHMIGALYRGGARCYIIDFPILNIMVRGRGYAIPQNI